MLELAIILTFLSVTGFIYFLATAFQSRNRQIHTRLERLRPVAPFYRQMDVNLDKPLTARILGPVAAKFARVALRFTPVNIQRQTEQLLDSAGHPWNLSVSDFLTIRMLVILCLPLLVIMATGHAPLHQKTLIIIASISLAFILPSFVLKRQVTMRQQRITRDLPDNLDLLTVSVEAGLGFDQALLKVVEKTKGPLTEEFKRFLHEIRIGKTRRDALREMSARTGVPDLQTFVAAIIQADQLGVSIGNVLRIQSRQLRQKRRLSAEERAQKAPIKMLLPMILFIFPSLFIILLGPGVLQLIDNFSKMK